MNALNMITWGRELQSCTNYVRLQQHHSSVSLLSLHLIIGKTFTLTLSGCCFRHPAILAIGRQPRITSECTFASERTDGSAPDVDAGLYCG